MNARQVMGPVYPDCGVCLSYSSEGCSASVIHRLTCVHSLQYWPDSGLGLLSRGVCCTESRRRYLGGTDRIGGWVSGNEVLEIHIRPKMDEIFCLGIECILKGDFSPIE